MVYSPNATFNLTADLIAEAAMARLGGEMVSGFDARSIQRNLQLLFQSWKNRLPEPLWEIDQQAVTLTAGVATYVLPADTLDVLQGIRISDPTNIGSSILVNRVGRDEYLGIPDKGTTGRPLAAWVDRQRDAPVLTLWPVPDVAGYVMSYPRWRSFRDVDSLMQNIDIPTRFLPAAISGLAWMMSMERMATIDIPTRQMLQQQYEGDFAEAAAEDRDRAPFAIRPDLSGYFGRW